LFSEESEFMREWHQKREDTQVEIGEWKKIDEGSEEKWRRK